MTSTRMKQQQWRWHQQGWRNNNGEGINKEDNNKKDGNNNKENNNNKERKNKKEGNNNKVSTTTKKKDKQEKTNTEPIGRNPVRLHAGPSPVVNQPYYGLVGSCEGPRKSSRGPRGVFATRNPAGLTAG